SSDTKLPRASKYIKHTVKTAQGNTVLWKQAASFNMLQSSSKTKAGHWEFDTIVGKKDENEPCALVMTERMTRMSLWMKAHHHTAEAISEVLQKMSAYFSEQCSSVFKTITADNGSEFADLSLVENRKTKVYFTHPYSSFEKGTVECHNRMFRRFIPKGKSIDDYSADDICFFADSINGLPRKTLGYKTPEELFEQELDLIYAA
ncbi:MAG: IS30 family transposase, partial [Firmicutes bacterium]|nr:IS30 family transposase [Bacillota bacterium]